MLNDSQRRRISITLSSLEEDMRDMERLIQADSYIGVLHESNNDIDPHIKETLIKDMQKIRIGFLAERFSLERDRRSLSRQLFSRLTYAWTTMEEIKSHSLKGYGSVDGRLKDTLDPDLNEIIGLIRDMENLLQSRA